MSQSSRRQFLRTLGALGVASPFVNTCSVDAKSVEVDVATGGKWDCIVCGAGLSGVTAADRLRRRGYRVLIVEGADRLGGRVHTLRDSTLFDEAVELGAEYVHRPDGSVPLWDDIKRCKLSSIRVPKKDATYVHDAESESLRTLSEHAAKLSWNLKTRFIPVYFGFQYRSTVQSFLDGLDDSDRAMAEMAIAGHLPAFPEKIDFHAYMRDGIFEQLNEPDDFRVTEGLDRIVEGMAAPTPVLLSHEVKVIRRDASGVKIQAVNKTDGSEIKLEARTSVCTFSVNMLKTDRVTFEPALPELRRQALDQIGMGDIAKVVIRFKQRFFPDDMSFLLWPQGEDVRQGPRTWFREHFGTKNAEPVLTAFLMGPDADSLRSWDDDRVLKKLCDDLDHIFPNAAVKAYDNIAMTTIDGTPHQRYIRRHWIKDEFALGGYSYIREGSKPVDPVRVRELIASPSDTRPLFWAGEAYAIRTQPSSMHGAHMSGIDAAHMVDQHLRYPLRDVVHPARMFRRVLRTGSKAMLKPRRRERVFKDDY